jgi:hypothetical protein
MLLPPPLGGRPPKTERPQRVLREDPITHHVAGPHQVEHRDKPGHSRAPPLVVPPSTRAADHPDARPLQQHQLHLTRRPGTDKQHSFHQCSLAWEAEARGSLTVKRSSGQAVERRGVPSLDQPGGASG